MGIAGKRTRYGTPGEDIYPRKINNREPIKRIFRSPGDHLARRLDMIRGTTQVRDRHAWHMGTIG